MDIEVGLVSSSLDFFFKKETPVAKQAASSRLRIANATDLAGFMRVSNDKLIHISKQDFWHLGQDDSGYFIERLVDDTSGPIKG